MHGRVDECLNVAKIFIKCWHFGLKRTEYQPRMVKKQEATEAAVVLGCVVSQSSVTNGLVASCAFITAMRSDVEVGQGAVVGVVRCCPRWFRLERRLPCAPKRPTIGIHGKSNAVVFPEISTDGYFDYRRCNSYGLSDRGYFTVRQAH